MKTQDFTNAIEDTYYKHFPASRCTAKFDTRFYSSIWVNCFLAGDKSELSGNYWDNDIMSIAFSIHAESGEFSKDVTLESELPETIVLEVEHKSYLIKPESRNMVYGRRKLSFRKATGNAEKMLQVFDKYFAQLKESLVNDLANGMIIDKNHNAVAVAKLS